VVASVSASATRSRPVRTEGGGNGQPAREIAEQTCRLGFELEPGVKPATPRGSYSGLREGKACFALQIFLQR
jgi:hypothetical protein